MASERKVLRINGAERKFICDPEKDTLAGVLRKLGLTGTKVGCGTGQCGACSILLDGKVVRSCTRKMKAVENGSCVVTIEGLGTAESLHPLQLAWMVHGGVQCGFCTPGFILSAKGLLDENHNPSREEVRDWFQKHRNICRCTGFKPLVDAVMDAAKVLRGEKTMEELAFKIPEDGKIYGTKMPRPAALAKVLGTCDYGDDIGMKMPEDTLHLALVMPGCSHANILSIDTGGAEKAKGVVKVLTSKDVKGSNRIEWALGHPRAHGDGFERPVLMDKKIFRYGDVIAIVAADTRENARRAAKLVKMKFEKLPEYLDALDAMADDAMQIHPGVPNIFQESPLFKGEDTREVIPASKYAAEGSFYTTREPHLPIEPDTAQAYVDDNGVVTVHIKSHGLHLTQGMIAGAIGVPVDKIRIIENPTGGSFGYSISPGTAAMAAIAAMATNRPVTLTMSYEEHQHFTGKRAASYINASLACDEKGKLTGGELEMVYDKGAYSELGPGLCEIGLRFFSWPYNLPNMMGLSKLTFSNHAFSTAYRGYGMPQVSTSTELLMDMLARKAGVDPLEFRYINVMREGDTGTPGFKPKVYPMEGILDKIRPKYKELLADARNRTDEKKKYGVGIACGGYVVGGTQDYAEAALELNPDGSVTCYATFQDLGQGGDISCLVNVHEALRPLGIKPEQINLCLNDTGTCPPTGLSAGSRMHYFGGNAVIDAAEKLMSAMGKADGTYRSYEEMVKEGIPVKYTGVYENRDETGPLDPNTGQGDPVSDYSYAAFAVEVEVDVATGKTKVLEYHTVTDVGTVGNYLALDGQVYGGASHCIGFALTEDYADVKKHATMVGAGIPTIDMVPDGDRFTVEYIQTPRPGGPQGSGGCSEAYQSSGHMAIINAIYDATGCAITTLPASPEKVKAAMDALARGEEQQTERYYLGGDFYDKLDYIKANPV